MLLEISGEKNSRKNEETEPKQKVDVTGDESKVQYCKEQYCIGTWNDRSMNQGKWKVVKQEVARVIINIFRNQQTKMDWNG